MSYRTVRVHVTDVPAVTRTISVERSTTTTELSTAHIASTNNREDDSMNDRAAHLTKQLGEIGEAIASSCSDLATRPRPDAAEILAYKLTGAARHVMLLQAELLKEAAP